MRKAPGILPNPQWLNDHGYGGLRQAMLKYPEAFAHIKQRKMLRPPQEWVPIAEKLAKHHKGVLPCVRWLERNGYGALTLAMRLHPLLFTHLQQEDKGGRTADEWVPIAERLAAQNGGTLPCGQWLRQHGHGGLAQAIYNRPELFLHVPQQSEKGRTPQEWVAVAEKLAGEHGGTLPTALTKNGYSGLDTAIRKHPHLFSHIPQKRRQRGHSPEHWIPLAEELAKEHGGTLPAQAWLVANGYSSLENARRRRPKLFSHIPQQRLKCSVRRWIPVAEQLAEEHGGTLPPHIWLAANGHRALVEVLRRHLSLFAHIPQQTKPVARSQRGRDWVAVASSLADGNGGVLPSRSWLAQNKYHGLLAARRKYPQLFAHIRQERKRVHTPEEWVPIAEALCKQNSGKLPCPRWLCDNSYVALDYAIRHNPHLFAHIPQTKYRIHRPLDEWVQIAERLVQEHDGQLPCSQWLKDNGFGALYLKIIKHPAAFANIPRARQQRPPEQWVSVAEKLAEERGGVLPNSKWLALNGYNGLHQAKHLHTHLFAHLKQHRKHRTPEEWVPIAEELARANKGELPNRSELVKRGYQNLPRVLEENPHLFAHIPQIRKSGRHFREWVSVAERMASEHNGRLPYQKWLIRNGYNGLTQAMRAHPEAFAHILQDKKQRRPEEWSLIAEKLAEERGGTLPNSKWLQINGYKGLDTAMRSYPQNFAHIKQERKQAAKTPTAGHPE